MFEKICRIGIIKYSKYDFKQKRICKLFKLFDLIWFELTSCWMYFLVEVLLSIKCHFFLLGEDFILTFQTKPMDLQELSKKVPHFYINNTQTAILHRWNMKIRNIIIKWNIQAQTSQTWYTISFDANVLAFVSNFDIRFQRQCAR